MAKEMITSKAYPNFSYEKGMYGDVDVEVFDTGMCPTCEDELDQFEAATRIAPITLDDGRKIMVCRDCYLDWLREKIFEDEGNGKAGLKRFYHMCEKSHYIKYLIDDWKTLLDELPEMWLGWIWDSLESNLIHDFKWFWIPAWDYINENNIKVMSDEDIEYWESLPDEITIYRGGGHEDGLCWTLDKEKAEWFSTRFHDEDDANVWVRTVKKSDCAAYHSGRGESEVIYLELAREGV